MIVKIRVKKNKEMKWVKMLEKMIKKSKSLRLRKKN